MKPNQEVSLKLWLKPEQVQTLLMPRVFKITTKGTGTHQRM